MPAETTRGMAKLVVDERGLVVLSVIFGVLFASGMTYRQLNGLEAGEVKETRVL